MGQDEGFLEAPACDLTDVPDCYIAGLDMALVQVGIVLDAIFPMQFKGGF